MGKTGGKPNITAIAAVVTGTALMLGGAITAVLFSHGTNAETSSVQPSVSENVSDSEPSGNVSHTQSESESTVTAPAKLPVTEVNVSVNEEDSVTTPAAVKNLVCNYLKEKYECLGTLTYKSLEAHFLLNDDRGKLYSYFCNASLDHLIFVRSSRRADLSFENAEVGITFTEFEKEQNTCRFKFLINDAIDFAFTEKTSYSCGMEVEAIAAFNSDRKLKFVQYAEDTDVNILVESKVLEWTGFDPDTDYLKDVELPEKTNIRAMFASISEDLKQTAAADIAKQERLLDRFNRKPAAFAEKKIADNPYRADKAVMYAYRWTGKDKIKRNQKFSDYSVYGGNCQNFVSQCLYKSGIPMDCTGRGLYEQWKWYSDNVNTWEMPYGRSTSWSGTEFFYYYCRDNTGSGLVAEISKNIYSGEIGDVLQYLVDGWAHHSVIITDIVRDKDGNVIDFLITGNTTDRVDFPMSAYGYTDLRLIKIIGYND